MTNRLLFEIVGALLGALGALAAVFAFVAGLFWLSDQSNVRSGGMTVLIALTLLLVAVGAVLGRRRLARMRSRTATPGSAI